jgi:hypothetical protein
LERRLRSVALSIWSSLGSPESTIPFLGLEAAAHGSESLADTLFHESVRMINTDAYRLATTIDAYASCAKALQMRLLFYKQPHLLRFRLEAMQKNIRDGLDHLLQARERRNDVPRVTGRGDKDDKLPPEIDKYADRVHKRCGRIILDLDYAF